METHGTTPMLPTASPGVVVTPPDSGARPSTAKPTNKTPEPKPEETERTEPKQLTNQDLQELTEDLNEHIRLFNTKVSFTVDDDTGQTVIHIRDTETDEVLREVPAEDMLKLAAKLSEVIGIIVDKMV